MVKNRIAVCNNGDEVNVAVEGRKVLAVWPSFVFKDHLYFDVLMQIRQKLNVKEIIDKDQIVVIFDDF